jgi:DHA2 family multidrug resistance protein
VVLAIALGNFLVVLDTTIANVSVPTIAGSLGVSASQGSWVITSYAVAEAITVPLTGWLSARFGAQGCFSLLFVLCGSLGALRHVDFAGHAGGLPRGAGSVRGPIMPLAQTLMLRLLPPEKQVLGTVIWAMTTLVGPIVGRCWADFVRQCWLALDLLHRRAGGGAGGLMLLVLLRGRG